MSIDEVAIQVEEHGIQMDQLIQIWLLFMKDICGRIGESLLQVVLVSDRDMLCKKLEP